MEASSSASRDVNYGGDAWQRSVLVIPLQIATCIDVESAQLGSLHTLTECLRVGAHAFDIPGRLARGSDCCRDVLRDRRLPYVSSSLYRARQRFESSRSGVSRVVLRAVWLGSAPLEPAGYSCVVTRRGPGRVQGSICACQCSEMGFVGGNREVRVAGD